jgi:catechol 2,3-dioxygenase-like lactoylglutathione lyase family enzyme
MRRIVPAACGVLIAAAAVAQAPAALPLQNLGLEHLDIIVPDTEASARFYARIFRTVLHQQPLQGGLRYFVLLGDLPADRQIGYVAIGAGQGRKPAGEPSTIEHYAIKVAPFDRDALTSRLRGLGVRTLPAPDEPDVFRFEDNNRIVVELRVAG